MFRIAHAKLSLIARSHAELLSVLPNITFAIAFSPDRSCSKFSGRPASRRIDDLASMEFMKMVPPTIVEIVIDIQRMKLSVEVAVATLSCSTWLWTARITGSNRSPEPNPPIIWYPMTCAVVVRGEKEMHNPVPMQMAAVPTHIASRKCPVR
jgi:hypothetical protein